MGKKRKLPSKQLRINLLSLLIAVLISVSGIQMVRIQIVNGENFLDKTNVQQISTRSIPAARGDILDRYGRMLATSKTSFNVIFDYAFIKKSELNKTILSVSKLFAEAEISWNNDAPIEKQGNEYRFTEGMENDAAKLKNILESGEQETAAQCIDIMKERYQINTPEKLNTYPIIYSDGKYIFDTDKKSKVNKLKEELGVNEDATAEQCMNKMLKNPQQYDIYNEDEAFILSCIRYSMERKDFSKDNQYTFAEDIPNELVVKIKEQSFSFAGVDIMEVPSRVYLNGNVASQIIGTIGPIYAEEYAELKQKGYAMNDVVGKSGVETALEDALRGINGKVQVIQDASGNVISTDTLQNAVTGSNVKLTIDIVFQEKLQNLLADFVSGAKSGKYRSKGGAIVVLDVKTGEVIAAVNSSNYTIEEYKKEYGKLLNDEKNPLFNRAIDGLYRPGSSLKPMIATAAMAEGKLSTRQQLQCVSPYKYGFSCLQDHHSGNINVKQSLHWSCNTFYYRLGEKLGIETMGKYAEYMGLGVKTGLEISQAKGRFAGPETTESLGGVWNAEGDVMQAAIGQNETAISPLQMACEAMTIANKGKRYETHLVHSFIDSKGNETLSEPVVASEFEMDISVYNAISEGMRLAASKVAAPNNLNNLGYGVAQKTGTAQTTAKNRVNNDFIGFLPIEDPEIAISCIVEDCNTGTASLMRNIITLYYECKRAGEENLSA